MVQGEGSIPVKVMLTVVQYTKSVLKIVVLAYTPISVPRQAKSLDAKNNITL